MSHAALRSRLPAMEPALALLQTRLLAALHGATGEGFRFSASVADEPRSPAVSFTTAAGPVEIVPLLAEGRVPALLADDGEPDAVLAMAALSTLEPLIEVVERQLGVALQPDAVAAPVLALRIRLDAVADDGVVRDSVILGVDPDAPLAPSAIRPVIGSAIRALRVDFAFVATGPSLAANRIAALSAGDLVVVGSRQLAGHFDAAGRLLAANYAPAAAAVTIVNQGKSSVSDIDERAADLDPDLRLPLTLRIAGGTVSLEDLSRLSSGSVIPLGIEGATMPVTLEIAGEAIAAGELVALGDAYGVLVTRRIATAS